MLETYELLKNSMAIAHHYPALPPAFCLKYAVILGHFGKVCSRNTTKLLALFGFCTSAAA